MNLRTLVQCLFAGISFGAWPNMVRSSEISPAWLTMYFGIGSVLVAGVHMMFRPETFETARQAQVGMAASVINAIGFMMYIVALSRVANASPSDVSVIIPTVTAVVTLTGSIIAMSYGQEPVTFRKVISILVIIAGVYGLQSAPRTN